VSKVFKISANYKVRMERDIRI